MFKAVIFDMDGLMIDSEPLWVKAEQATCRDLKINFTPDLYSLTTGMRYDEVVDYWYRKLDLKDPTVEVAAEILLNNAIDFIIEEARVFPGIFELLDDFKAKNIICALASSSPYRLINAVLENFNFQNYFSVVCSAEDEDFGKPHPAVYISAAKKSNLCPRSCLVLEDSINGVIAAKAAKMSVVAIPDKTQFLNPGYGIADYKFSSLAQSYKEISNLLN